MVDVFVNGVKFVNGTDFTATDGTTVVMAAGLAAGNIVEIDNLLTAYLPTNALRTITTFTATAAQTTFSVSYTQGLIDVFYNGSNLAQSEYTATNGTSIILATACQLNDIVVVYAYSYSVGAYSGIAGSGTINTIPKFTASSTIGDSAITDNGTTVTLVSRALSGTSATFSGNIGVGVTTISAWGSIFRVLEGGDTNNQSAIAFQNSANVLYLTTNSYFDTGWKYKFTDVAGQYLIDGSDHRWYTAASGTADNALTWVQRMNLDASGNLGIGTSSPSGKLHLSSTGDTYFVMTGGGTPLTYSLLVDSTNLRLFSGVGATTLLTIASTGAATFSSSVTATTGTLSTAYNGGSVGQLHITSSGTEGGTITFEKTSGTAQKYKFGLGTTSLFIYNETAGNQPFTLTSGGNVGIGMTGYSDMRLAVRGAGATSATFGFRVESSAANALFQVRNDGLIETGTQTNSPYNISATGRTAILSSSGVLGYLVSTRESKANIESISNVDFINQLNPVQFNYRKKDNITNEFTDELYDNITYGFIADEVEKVNKDLVFYQEDGVTLAGVEYNNMIAILTKAIQEQQAQIEELKKIVATK
jgi:hypothetical protein